MLKSPLGNQIKGFWQRLYRLYAIRKNVILGHQVHLGIGTVIDAPHKLNIGNRVYIGKNCTIECDGRIGNDVVIANLVGMIGRFDHDYHQIDKSIFRSAWIGDQNYAGAGKGLEILIEDDVWIGYGAIILTGVKVGRGAIVGAGSVVSKDVLPYSIVAGVPAHQIAIRFNHDEIIQHEQILYGRRLTTFTAELTEEPRV